MLAMLVTAPRQQPSSRSKSSANLAIRSALPSIHAAGWSSASFPGSAETAEAFDAAVVDVNLDGEKSYPVVDALTARGVPFVFSTGYGKAGIAAKYGAFTVLQKPYAVSKLGDALSRLLTALIQRGDARVGV
jgi:FixJ family two-component response regulator